MTYQRSIIIPPHLIYILFKCWICSKKTSLASGTEWVKTNHNCSDKHRASFWGWFTEGLHSANRLVICLFSNNVRNHKDISYHIPGRQFQTEKDIHTQHRNGVQETWKVVRWLRNSWVLDVRTFAETIENTVLMTTISEVFTLHLIMYLNRLKP